MKKLAFAFVAMLSGLAIIMPEMFPERIWLPQIDLVLMEPSWRLSFGADALGRDLFFRLLEGARYSLLIGLVSALLSLLFGAGYGLISGWLGGFTDQLMMRFQEIITSVPQLILIGLLTLLFQVNQESSGILSLLPIALAISLGSWMGFARLARNLIIAEKERTYIKAAIVLGGSTPRLLAQHVLPNISLPLISYTGQQISYFLLFESVLSFIGIGVQPPMASWGLLIQEGWRTLSVYPHLILGPSLILFLTVYSLNLLARPRSTI